MLFIKRLIFSIDALTELTGRIFSCLILFMAILSSTLVLLRYGFNIGSIAWQELLVYWHASLFMLTLAYALKHQQHVRVDIFYQRLSAHSRAWVNAVFTLLFLLPLCGFLGLTSLTMVEQSWLISEGSADTGGLQGVYLLKTLIPLSMLLLFLQGLCECLRAAVALIEKRE